MAFWIKKKTDEQDENEKDVDPAVAAAKRKKKEKEAQTPKRIDNLRIPQSLRITLKSLGSPNEFIFLTKDLSATGAFVLCPNFKRYPFQPASTILDATVDVIEPETNELYRLQFLAKVARVVEAHGEGANSISGFGIRFVQIALEHRLFLENFVAKHGAPEVVAPTSTAPLSSPVQGLDDDNLTDGEDDELAAV